VSIIQIELYNPISITKQSKSIKFLQDLLNDCPSSIRLDRLLPPRLAPSPSFGLVGHEPSRPAYSCNPTRLWAKPVASRVVVALSQMAEGLFNPFSFSFSSFDSNQLKLWNFISIGILLQNS
jgi:hypothetical protein